ncbi:hypothetical protein [Vogesella sp. LIG4]|uniref:hypothetical protein n=1 Tax=Vogesella sp. LIG4 TaxID=1192162 RepID=UPI00081FD323|nr:hypothetical protein [Vogesella sp. LIG4]SCK12087.1 hypothetical protein PSELUDRAFT_1061 [Vogesella sp. LIG4]
MNYRMIAAAALLLGSTVAGAATVKYQLGVEAYHETYKETNGGQPFMKEEAPMLGLNGAAIIATSPLDEVVLDGRFARGKSDYTGAYQGGQYGSVQLSDLKRHTWELGATYKHLVPDWDGAKLGLGIGTRYLEDRLDKYVGGYRRENTLNYLSFVLERPTQLSDGWSVNPAFKYKLLLNGTQKSHVSGGTLTHNQDKGMGYDLSLEFAKTSGQTEWVITPFLRAWHIKTSESVYVVNNSTLYQTYEPDNTTKEIGISLGVRF